MSPAIAGAAKADLDRCFVARRCGRKRCRKRAVTSIAMLGHPPGFDTPGSHHPAGAITMSNAATSSPFASSCADALDMLSLGHEQTRTLADECRRFARHVSADAAMQEVAEALCRAIHRMAALEEELFFPAARAALEASSLVDLAELEHATARQIIRHLQATDPREARYEALVLALTECVERHARHEQAQLFPRLRESSLDMDALERQLNERLCAHNDEVFVVEERRHQALATAH